MEKNEELSVSVADNVDAEVVEAVEDWQAWEEDISSSALDGLKDDGSSIRKRKGHYSNDSRTTKWRRRVEAANVDDNKQLTHPQEELLLINESMEALHEQIKPVMNKKREGSSLDSYNVFRLISVFRYFENCLEGLKKGEASQKIAESLWPDNSRNY